MNREAEVFEKVYTYDWFDGPRQGVADLGGVAHLFASEGRDYQSSDEDVFLLMPIDVDTFDLVIEKWEIWRRWETAFHQGMTTQQTHPALPQDRTRHEELARLLEGRLKIEPSNAIRKRAQFRVRSDPNWSGLGWSPLEVEWEELPSLE